MLKPEIERTDLMARRLCQGWPQRFALLWAASAIFFQAGSAQTPSGKGRMEGVLVNQVTKQPVRKATLRLQSQEITSSAASGARTPANYTATSDYEGRFVFDLIAPGRYTLTVDHPGYAPASYRARGSTRLTIHADQTIGDVYFQLVPYGVITGRVADEDGNPMTEVQIYALRHERWNGRRRLRTVGLPASADEQGNFRIANLAPGQYIVYAKLTRRATSNAGGEEVSYVTTYYPRALRLVDAASLTVTPGAEVSAVIPLRKERVFGVEGKVTDPASGALIPDRVILNLKHQLENQEAASVNVEVTFARDGAFRFAAVAPGSYWIETSLVNLIVNGRMAVPVRFFGRYPVTVTREDLANIVIPLAAGVNVTGIISAEDQQTSSSEARPGKMVAVKLSAESPAYYTFGGQSKDDGSFRLGNVAPGRYRVSVTDLPEGYYVKSLALNGQASSNGIIPLSPGVDARLDIIVSPKGAEVHGTVHRDKGEAAEDILVTLTAISDSLSAELLSFRQTRTDQNGQFRIKGLAPGEYRILAWEEVDVNWAMDPELRTNLRSQSRTVKLEESGRESVRLELVGRDSIEAAMARLR